MSLFVILLGGNLAVTERLKRQIAGARVIAADSGIRHAQTLGISVEAWIGDFDSSTPEMDQTYNSIPRLAFSADKAMTDGELAVEEAIRRGANALVLAGALGGPRSDHAMQHVMLMLALAERGIPVLLTSGAEEALPLLAGECRPDLPPGTVFSIIALDNLSGLSVKGAKWPLDRQNAAFGSSLTLSNQAKEGLSINLKRGCAAIFANLSTS